MDRPQTAVAPLWTMRCHESPGTPLLDAHPHQSLGNWSKLVVCAFN